MKVVGVGISILLALFAFYYFDWASILQILKGIKPEFLFYLLVIYTFDYYVRAFRWKLLCSPLKKSISLQKLFYSYNIASFSCVFLPLRGGEWFRIWITGREENIQKRALLGTLILEKTLDMLGMGILLIIACSVAKKGIAESDRGLSTLRLFGILFILVFLFTILVVFILKPIFLRGKMERFPKIKEFFDRLLDGYSSINQFSLLIPLILLSIGMWFLNAFILQLYIASLSFGTTFFESAKVLLFQGVGELIPSAPSSIGTLHASTVMGCKFIGLTAAQGLSVGILNHAVDVIVRILFGVLSLQILRVDFIAALKNIKLRHA